MGVHGLWELLAPVGRRVSVELLSNKKLAIDASIWIIQFLKAMRDERGELMRNAHLLGFFRRICKLLFLRVKPVFVFDGGTPFLKRRTVIARRRQREQAQSKLRKTAEKLLLNHLKAKRLEELVQEEQGKSQEKGKGKAPAKSSSDIPGQATSHTSQENADALLAASLATEWEDGLQSPKELQVDSDDDEQQILPTVVHGKVDPAVLAALPPSMQLKLLDEMREQLVAENRQKFQRVAKAPASFSQLQIQAYLKTVAFRRDIVQVQKAAANRNVDGVPSARIGSEAGREYIFSSDSVNKRTEKLAQNVASGAPETVKDAPLLQKLEQAQEKEKDHVQTYFDDRGNKRVSRIRGMGVRMTRDLQWNLYLMRDKEAHGKEDGNEAEPVEDADNALFEKLVSEKPIEEDGNSNDESEVEWDDGPANGEKNNEKDGSTKESIQISFVDDGSVEADDMFDKLVSESQAEEIEWEEGDREDEATVKPVDNSETIGKEQDIIEVSFTDDGSLRADDHMFENLIFESNATEWEDDTPPTVLIGETTKHDKHNQEVRSLDGVSEEQAQLEEAIRQSLMDYKRQQVHKALNIQEVGPNQENAVQNRIEPSEAERSSKGKGLLNEQTQDALDAKMDDFETRVSDKVQSVEDRMQEDQQSADTDLKQVARANDQQPPTEERQSETVFATEEEERFLEAEEAAARLAMIDEEREKLYQEDAELRAQQKKNERNAESVTNEMFSECQELLQLFGVPYVIAPMEAEAQCAHMDASKLVDGVITDDSDVFLFGGRSVFKNIFDGHKYVETYYMKDAEADLGLNREKLIRMAMLLGSDYTEGISGIGIVNAIEVVNAFPEEDGLEKLKEWIESPDLMIFDKLEQKSRKNKNSRKKTDSQDQLEDTDQSDPIDELDKRKQQFMQTHRAVSKNWTVPPSFPSKAVFEAYASPQVDKSTETFTWGRPDLDLLRKFCFEKFGWTPAKADELLLPVLKEYDRRETQLRLDAFYSFNHRFAKIRSTRIQKAVTGITGQRRPELMFGYTEDTKPTKRKRAAQQQRKDAPARKRDKMESSAADQAQKKSTRTRRKSKASSKIDGAKDNDRHPEETREQSAPLQNEAEGSVPPNEHGQGIVLSDKEARVHVGRNESLEQDSEGNVEATGIVTEGSLPEMQPCSGMYAGGGFIVEDDAAEGAGFEQKNQDNLEVNINTGGTSMAEENEPRSDPSLLAVPFFRRKRRSYG